MRNPVRPTFVVAFEVDGAAHEVTVAPDGTVQPPSAAIELGLALENDPVAGTWRLLSTPRREVTVTSVTATIPCRIKRYDSVFLNGYQSWTDSFERPTSARMHDLRRVPKAIVDKFQLDGAGDYRFTPYGRRRGEQHGFGYGYLRLGDDVKLLGSLCEDSGFTTLRCSAHDDCVRVEKEPPARPLAAGERRELVSFVELEGSLDDCVATWLSMAGVSARKAPAVAGFTSWYRHYEDIDEPGLLHDLGGMACALAGVEMGDVMPLFQVDDGWTRVGDWLEFRRDRFPFGLKPLVKAIREQGFVPGLWLAPLLCERESRTFKEHPRWLYRYADTGELATTGCNWSGAFALDTRNPEVREYVTRVLQTVTRDWGFEVLKLDFLFAGCMEPHDGLNRGELMADALDLIREAVGDDVRLLLCGVPLTSAFGRADWCRIGCDVGLDWDDKPFMRVLHRERVSTKNSLANTRGRAHLDGRAFGCDPDVFFLRGGDVKLSEARKAELLDADTVLGSVFLTSDDMSAWDNDQLVRYRKALKRFCERKG